MNGLDAVAEILRREDVPFVACEGAAPIPDYCGDVGIRIINCRQERVAVDIAHGYARVSQNPGVCSMMATGGIENSFAGVAHAWEDQQPILVLPGGISRLRKGNRDFEAVQSFLRVTKWAHSINFTDRVPEMMRRAFTYLRCGRSGPVLLELLAELRNEELSSPLEYTPVTPWKPAGNPRDVEVAVRGLLDAKHPLIYVGTGVYRAKAEEELKEFVELVQAPVITTMNAKGAFPENHPLSVGFIRGEPTAHFLDKADLVFGVGASFHKHFTALIVPKGKRIVQTACIDEFDINREYPVNHAVIGDAKLVLRQMINEVKKQGTRRENQALLKEIQEVKAQHLTTWMQWLTSNDKPINPYRVMWDLMQTIDRDNSIVTHDAGNPRDQLSSFWETTVPHGYIGWGHVTTLGFGLGATIGAALAMPERLAINFIGDASIGQVGMDLETPVRTKIPMMTVVLNNGQYGGYEHHYRHPETYLVTGDYTKIAEGLGAYSERIEDPDEVIPAIKRGVKSVDAGRYVVLEMMTANFPKFPRFAGHQPRH